jgi:hypothetical protein
LFALGFAAVILTHAITTYLCALAVALMTFFYLLPSNRLDVGRRGLARLAAASLLALALAAFFLVPQQLELHRVNIGLQVVKQDYHNYFLFAGAADGSPYRRNWAGINFAASLIILAQTSMALLLGFLCRRGQNVIIFSALGLAVFGLYISLPLSEPLWRYLPGLKFIQFPWRFQPFVALACGLLAASAVDHWKSSPRPLRLLVAASLTWLAIANLAFTFIISRLDEPRLSRQQVAHLLGPSDLKPIAIEEEQELSDKDDLKMMPYIANQSSYRPRGADFNLYPPAAQPGGLSFIAGEGRVVSQRLEISRREFHIENDLPARLRIETYHYPHWIARLDGEQVKIDTDHEELMLIDLPAGNHHLVLSFEVRDRPQRIARWVSILAWLALTSWIILGRRL